MVRSTMAWVCAVAVVMCVGGVCGGGVRGSAAGAEPELAFYALVRDAYPNQANCTLHMVDAATGNSTYVRALPGVCADRSEPNSRASIAYVPPGTATPLGSGVVVFTTGSGNNIYGIDPSADGPAGITTVALPQGLAVVSVGVVGGAVYVLAPDTVYEIAKGGVLTPVVKSVGGAVGNAVAWGSAGAFAATGDDVITVDVADGTALRMPVDLQVLNLDVYAAKGPSTLIALANYELYSVDADNGNTAKLWDVPDGTGYPSTHALVGSTYVFADFQFIYVLDLTSLSVLSKSPFNGYFCEGGIVHLTSAS